MVIHSLSGVIKVSGNPDISNYVEKKFFTPFEKLKILSFRMCPYTNKFDL